MSNTDVVLQGILNGINRFISFFMENSYYYLCERDIQCHLFAVLREEIEKLETPSVEIRNVQFKRKKLSQSNVFNIHLFNAEYSEEKFDLAYIDRPNVVDFDKFCEVTGKTEKELNTDPLWNQPLRLAIELKYITCGYLKSVIEVVKSDYQKLIKYQSKSFRGKLYSPNFRFLSLCFVQEEKYFEEEISRNEDYLDLQKGGLKDFNSVYVIGKGGVYKLNERGCSLLKG